MKRLFKRLLLIAVLCMTAFYLSKYFPKYTDIFVTMLGYFTGVILSDLFWESGPVVRMGKATWQAMVNASMRF